MTTATADRTLVFDKTIIVADHFRVQLQRHTYDDGSEEITAHVPADWDFGDWRKDEPDAGPDGAMHPDHNAVLKDCSREIGFDLVYADLDGGIDITEDGPITLTFERAPDAPASAGDQAPEGGQPEAAAPEAAAPPAEVEPPRLQGLSEVELLRRQLHKAHQQLAHYQMDQVDRRRKAQRIAQLRQVMEEDKKRLAGSKADLEEAILGWCNEEAAEEPLWDFAARSEPAMPPTNGTHQPATPSANGASAKGPHGAQPPASDAWKKEPLAVLGLSETILKKLDANDPPLRTVGELQQMVERLGKEGFTDPIAQIKGIGAKTAEKIDAAFQEFWARRPAESEPAPEAKPMEAPAEQPTTGMSPAAESNGEADAPALATPAVDAQAKALTEALTATQGAAERWAKLKASGATDAQLKAAIATEFGAAGGGSEFHFEGGKAPKFWLGESREGKPTLAGKALVAKVREVMGVPEGGEEAE